MRETNRFNAHSVADLIIMKKAFMLERTHFCLFSISMLTVVSNYVNILNCSHKCWKVKNIKGVVADYVHMFLFQMPGYITSVSELSVKAQLSCGFYLTIAFFNKRFIACVNTCSLSLNWIWPCFHLYTQAVILTMTLAGNLKAFFYRPHIWRIHS